MDIKSKTAQIQGSESTLSQAPPAAVMMTAASWEAIAWSKPFRFSVGPNKREFTLPSGLVAQQSTALAALVNNDQFKEARDAHAEWESVDEFTFIGFLQYAYTGGYAKIMAQTPSISGAATSKSSGVSSTTPPLLLVKKRAHNSEQSDNDTEWMKFSNAVAKQREALRIHQPRPLLSEPLPVAETLLMHAKVHVFADCYNITGLADLALYRLGHALVGFTLTDDNVKDIIRLLQYCFEQPTPERLRDSVLSYAACKAATLLKDDSFRSLLEEQWDLAIGLIQALAKDRD